MPRFGFVAGQWLSFKTNKPDGEEITRAYSIASAPGDNNRFALCLNRVQDGFMSNFLCDMKEGEEISCQGPFGDFILRPPLRDTIFIATGTGIAPFRSMLHWLLADPDRHQDKQLWLLFGNRTKDRHLLSRRIPETGRPALKLSLSADSQPRRSGMARPAWIRPGTRAGNRPGPHRYARLHLRARQNDQSQSRLAEGLGLGPEIDPVREVRLGKSSNSFAIFADPALPILCG